MYFPVGYSDLLYGAFQISTIMLILVSFCGYREYPRTFFVLGAIASSIIQTKLDMWTHGMSFEKAAIMTGFTCLISVVGGIWLLRGQRRTEVSAPNKDTEKDSRVLIKITSPLPRPGWEEE